MMSFNSIITILQKIIDVSLVWVLIYFVLKNLFLVTNKEKIYAYIVSIMTIVTLFFMIF